MEVLDECDEERLNMIFSVLEVGKQGEEFLARRMGHDSCLPFKAFVVLNSSTISPKWGASANIPPVL